MSDSLRPHGSYSPWNSPGQNTGVGSLSHLQGIFPIQGSNPDFPHCRWIFYQLSHKTSSRILECVAYPSPVVLPDPGLEPGSSALQMDSLPTELSGSPSHQERPCIFYMWKQIIYLLIFNINLLFMYLWQYCIFIAAYMLSLVAVSRGYSLVVAPGLYSE